MGGWLESRPKKFHFQEIDWGIYLPRHGNKGKYRDYKVMFRDRKRGVTQQGKRINLGKVLDNTEIDRGYPHIVGFYKVSSGQGADFKPQYLELRKIATVEDL